MRVALEELEMRDAFGEEVPLWKDGLWCKLVWRLVADVAEENEEEAWGMRLWGLLCVLLGKPT